MECFVEGKGVGGNFIISYNVKIKMNNFEKERNHRHVGPSYVAEYAISNLGLDTLLKVEYFCIMINFIMLIMEK